jgi:hypothetical protein
MNNENKLKKSLNDIQKRLNYYTIMRANEEYVKALIKAQQQIQKNLNNIRLNKISKQPRNKNSKISKSVASTSKSKTLKK